LELIQNEEEAMFRKDLIDLLQHHPATLRELSEQLEEPVKDMESDLRHLLKSLRHLPYRAVITPAHCNKCNFVFHKDKLHKPSKCPRCKSAWISEPRIAIEKRP
jgi:predicted Zn-ribbon and HTH transcriptional regulator